MLWFLGDFEIIYHINDISFGFAVKFQIYCTKCKLYYQITTKLLFNQVSFLKKIGE